MLDRFSHMPASLLRQSRFVRLSDRDVPALLAHPDWSTKAPVVIWLHGRSVNKELDPGRYLRWIRAGIAACAIDLPGHGEREAPGMGSPEQTLHVVNEALHDVDRVVEALAGPQYEHLFDAQRLAIGGMSAGGMTALRRLCGDHPFLCAAVESTAGDFSHMRYEDRFSDELIARLDPSRHLDSWRPIPLLALHSEADQWVPVEAIRSFTNRLSERYRRLGADATMVELHTWKATGAPYEHAGFGRKANDAKNRQVAFLTQHLLTPSSSPSSAG